jgi:hypothetical protein
MTLRTPPAFVGKITITSANNRVAWVETGPFSLAATVASGEYWPDTLAALIANAMTTQSGLSGANNAYTGTFSEVTGKITITRSGGTATFSLSTSTGSAQNILLGGTTDSAVDTLATGQATLNHLGFRAGSATGFANAHTSPEQIANVWVPSLPPSQDSEERFDQTVLEAYAINGEGEVYAFNTWGVDKDEWPISGHLGRRRELTFAFLTQEDTTQFLAWFWGAYAGQGKTFRYHPDRANFTDYQLYRLTGESLLSMDRGERQTGYALWSRTIQMRRVTA